MDKFLSSAVKRLKPLEERIVTLYNNILYAKVTTKKKARRNISRARHRVAHPSAYFPALSSDCITSTISLTIRFARQPARGYISRCASTWASNKTGGGSIRVRESLQSRHRGTRDATRERQFSRPQWHTSSFVVVTMPSVDMYLRRWEREKEREKPRRKRTRERERGATSRRMWEEKSRERSRRTRSGEAERRRNPFSLLYSYSDTMGRTLPLVPRPAPSYLSLSVSLSLTLSQIVGPLPLRATPVRLSLA